MTKTTTIMVMVAVGSILLLGSTIIFFSIPKSPEPTELKNVYVLTVYRVGWHNEVFESENRLTAYWTDDRLTVCEIPYSGFEIKLAEYKDASYWRMERVTK